MRKLLKKITWCFPILKNVLYKKELWTLRNSRFFDEKYYLSMRADVAAKMKDPVSHYFLYGWREGVNPSELFSTQEYLNAYKDVNFNPLLHYEWFGKNEKRTAGIKIFLIEQIDVISHTVERVLKQQQMQKILEEEERNHR